MTAARSSIVSAKASVSMLAWTNRALEALWLLAVLLVPLAFLGQNYAVSEAVIAYVEVPKIAILRTLAGLMAILWLIEWGLGGRFDIATPAQGRNPEVPLTGRLAQLRSWLQDKPTRWVTLSVWFFLGSTVISTVLSASFRVSLWGEIPGQDGFSAYTIVAYIVIFGVMATHLRTQAQMWRLVAALVATGVAVSGYAALQYFELDFLGLAEPTGGGTDRVTSTMGNAVFSAAFMSLIIPVSLVAAVITLPNPAEPNDSRRGKTIPRLRALILASLWALAIAVQLLGLTFTFSRGSWGGTVLSLALFLGLAALWVGRREMGRASLILGLSGSLTLASVLWPHTTSFLAIGGFLGLMAIYVVWGSGRASIVLGLVMSLVVIGVVATVWMGGPGDGIGSIPTAPAEGGPSPANLVMERFASITSEVSGNTVGGSFAERREIWRGSWRLIQHRPWFQFDELSLPGLRHVIGYGPDMFRYVYLLESPPGQINKLPVEVDHAHNYLIHQTVEQGVLGLLNSLGILVAPLLVGGYQLLRHQQDYSQVHKLVLVGLLAAMAGRFLEQVVGLARVSDLTLFWVLLAIFASLPTVMKAREPRSDMAPGPHRRPRQHHPRPYPNQVQPAFDWQLCLRLAVLAWLIGGIGALTWVKAINYPRAAVVAGKGLEHLNRGDAQAALADLDRAIKLAPDVPVYYNYRATVYSMYRDHKEWPTEQGCGSQTEVSYDSCLAQMVYYSNLAAVEQRPFYWRSRLALANSAFLLRLDDEAIRLYEEALSLVPHSWAMHNLVAEVYIAIGRPEAALKPLEESLVITRGTTNAADALFLQGVAYRDLGRREESVLSMQRSLENGLAGSSAQDAKQMLEELRANPGTP